MTPPLVPSSPGESELAYLYIAHNTFEHGVHQWYKVGITSDLATRRRTLRGTGNVGQFVMLKAWQLPAASAKPIERAIHTRLDEEGLRVTRDREFFAGPWTDLAERVVRILGVLSPGATETTLPPVPPSRSRRTRNKSDPYHRHDSPPVQQDEPAPNQDARGELELVLPGDKEFWDDWDQGSTEEHQTYQNGEIYWKALKEHGTRNWYLLDKWRHALFATREELRTSLYALCHLAPAMPSVSSKPDPTPVIFGTLQLCIYFRDLPSPTQAAHIALAEAQACARGQFSFRVSCAEENRTAPAPEKVTKHARQNANQVVSDISSIERFCNEISGPSLIGPGELYRFPRIAEHIIFHEIETVDRVLTAEAWFWPDYAIDTGLMGKDGPLPTNVPLPPELAEELLSCPDSYPWVHYLYHVHKQSQRGLSALRIPRPAMDRSAEKLHNAAAWLSGRNIIIDRRLLDTAVDSEIAT